VHELYGKESVSYNVHLMVHMTSSVEKWGPLWGASAFVFEDAYGKLMSMFHGTQDVPSQMFKLFMAHRKLSLFNKYFLPNSPEFCAFERLSSSTMRSNLRGRTLGERCTSLGQFVLCLLSLAEVIAVENMSDCTLQSKQFRCFQRFLLRGRVLSTEQYSNTYKRNNSVVKLGDGRHGIVVKCCISAECHCSNVRACDTHKYIIIVRILRPRSVARQVRLHDADVLNL